MIHLYDMATKSEKEKWQKLNGDEFDEFIEQMKQKYHGPIYKAFDDLPPVLRDLIKETCLTSKNVAESLNEVGDVYVSEANKLFFRSRELWDVITKDL